MSGRSTGHEEEGIKRERGKGIEDRESPVGPEAPIGVFDSGIGGLTVVRALRERLPSEDIVYLGDTARVPYGTKSADTITRFAVEDAGFLVGRGVKLIVVACHSASSVALPELERRFGPPVVGVIEPGAKALVAATERNRVGVIGTHATIGSAAYERAIRAERPGIEILAKPTPLFVPLAEEGWTDNRVAEQAAHEYLDGMKREGIDALLLGCTHFPLLADVIGRVTGREVKLVDSSEATADSVRGLLGEQGLLKEAGEGSQRFYLTDLTPNFAAVGARFLGAAPGEVMRASVAGRDT